MDGHGVPVLRPPGLDSLHGHVHSRSRRWLSKRKNAVCPGGGVRESVGKSSILGSIWKSSLWKVDFREEMLVTKGRQFDIVDVPSTGKANETKEWCLP